MSCPHCKDIEQEKKEMYQQYKGHIHKLTKLVDEYVDLLEQKDQIIDDQKGIIWKQEEEIKK